MTSSLEAFSLGDAASALSTANSVAQSATAVSNTASKSDTQSSDLIGMLTSQLGVSDKQASGGVGSILSYAKDELPSNDYATLASAIPNASSLLAMAPKSNDTVSALGALAGGSSASGMAALASQFSSLGLNSSMISQFVPIIMDYFKGSGSTDAMSILSGLFK
jgi:hypothetical protein